MFLTELININLEETLRLWEYIKKIKTDIICNWPICGGEWVTIYVKNMDKVHIIHFRAIILACGCFWGFFPPQSFVDDFRWGSKMAATWVKALNCEIESTVILNCHYESRTSIQRGGKKIRFLTYIQSELCIMFIILEWKEWHHLFTWYSPSFLLTVKPF